MASDRPVARKDLVLQEVGREGLLYDRDGELVHVLNVTALEIWKACDGARDLDAIEAVLKGRFTTSQQHDVRTDIEKLITQLDERGLLEGSDSRPASAARRGLTDEPQRRS